MSVLGILFETVFVCTLIYLVHILFPFNKVWKEKIICWILNFEVYNELLYARIFF